MKKIRERFFDPRTEKLAEKILLLLPFIFLFIHFFISVFLTLRFQQFTYDEFVVYSVSQQPLSQLSNTLLSEPHPFGFYLLIKAFSYLIHSATYLKIAFLCISTSLFLLTAFCSLHFLKKRYPYIPILLTLLFSSFGFGQILSTLKQDIFSVPVELLLCFLILQRIEKNTQGFLKNFLLPTILLLLIFSLGYVAFVNSFIVFLIFTGVQFFRQKKLSYFIPTVLILLIGLSYFFVFGYQQYLINTTRFAWINQQSNDFLSNFSIFLSGAEPQHLLTDLTLLFFISGIFLFTYNWKSFNTKEIQTFSILLFFILALSPIQYYFQLFAEYRYVFMTFFYIFIFTAKGFSYIYKPILVFLLLIFFIISTSVMFRGKVVVGYATSSFLHLLSQETTDQKTGFVSATPLSSLYFKLQYFDQNENFVALNPTTDVSQFFDKKTFEKDDLMLDGKTNFLLKDSDFFKKIEAEKIERIVYYDLSDRYASNTSRFFDFLLSHCTYNQTIYNQFGHSLNIFSQCKSLSN